MEARRIEVGRLLLSKGIINPIQYKHGIEELERNPEKHIGQVLIDLGYVVEDDFAEILHDQIKDLAL